MFSCTFRDSICFQKLILSMPTNVNEVNLIIDADLMEFQGFSNQLAALSSIQIQSKQFDLFQLKNTKNIILGIDMSSLIKIIKKIKRGDIIKMYIKNKNSSIQFKFESKSNELRSYKLKQISLKQQKIYFHNIQYPTIFNMKSSEIFEIILNDTLCKMESDESEQEIAVKSESNGIIKFNDYIPKTIKIIEIEDNNDFCQHFCLKYLNDFISTRLSSEIKPRINDKIWKKIIKKLLINKYAKFNPNLNDIILIIGKYAIDILEEYWFSIIYNTDITIKIGEDLPLWIEFKTNKSKHIGSNGSMINLLAPRQFE